MSNAHANLSVGEVLAALSSLSPDDIELVKVRCVQLQAGSRRGARPQKTAKKAAPASSSPKKEKKGPDRKIKSNPDWAFPVFQEFKKLQKEAKKAARAEKCSLRDCSLGEKYLQAKEAWDAFRASAEYAEVTKARQLQAEAEGLQGSS